MIPMIISIIDKLNKLNVDGLLINTSDYHNNEYIGPSDKILEAVTLFTGSNGMAVVGKTQGLFYTDARYHVQAQNEIDTKYWDFEKDDTKFLEKINKNFPKIILDRRYFSYKRLQNLQSKIPNTKIIGNEDIIDDIWEGRPLKLFQPLLDLENLSFISYVDDKIKKLVKIPEELENKKINVSGSYREEKIKSLKNYIKQDEIILLTALDEIAWVLNLRGTDIPFNPVFYSYLFMSSEKTVLFTDMDIKINEIEIKPYDYFLENVSKIQNCKTYITSSCNSLIYEKLVENKNTIIPFDYVSESKAEKNIVEIIGFKISHLYDAIALVKLFETLENQIVRDKKRVKESDIDILLDSLKSEFKAYRGPSFETIAGYGKNGAIIHHRGGSQEICCDNLLLIDSGAQYFLGTTDITRTICLGNPTDNQRADFTNVLKGQISAITQKFHKDFPASYLDAITRSPIWNSFQDFAHSTGHGVGHFLNVHESPPFIGKCDSKLKTNMIFSIEPGIYKENNYGIRIEDLVLSKSSSNDYIEFENLTLTPLQLKMIDFSKLSQSEKDYLNSFNTRIRNILKDFISPEEVGYKFFMENTELIS